MLTNDEVYQNIINAHLLLLKDPFLNEELIDAIKNEKITAKDAVEKVFNRYINLMQDLKNEYLKERYVDFLDIKNRVIQNLHKTSVSFKNLSECILIVDELLPSLLADITPNIKGIIAKKGGYMAHSAIVCRSRNLPYVIADIPSDYQGNIIIKNDEIFLNPSQNIISDVIKLNQENSCVDKEIKGIKVWANVSNNEDIDYVSKVFSGIGLYRTEFLFKSIEFAMNVEKQISIYCAALEKINGRIITFRTFDFGDDKKCVFMPLAQKGVSTYYLYRKIFLTQIEALVRVAKKYPNQVRIMFPMIERIDEYDNLKEDVLALAYQYGVDHLPIGMMLETQQALINLESFKKVDFISIGTNDLTWELFNIDRNEAMIYEHIYDDLLKVIQKVVDFTKAYDIHLSVCGELISQEIFARKAIKGGLENISIAPSMLKHIYKAINEGDDKDA